jgi:3-hydroxyisobutyrate dehydrogenase-like beta-hydroxyacid dehydrogenase
VEQEKQMQVGFIGLGIMGSRMATNLYKQGHPLVVHNRTKAKTEALIANGAAWADTPSQLADQVNVLFTMLSTPEVVAQVALGREGFLDHLKPGALWVDCSTVNPSFSRQMAAESRKRQIHFLDAPVVGTKDPAEKGQLVFLVGGDPADAQACQLNFSVMGRQVNHMGENGTGTAAKMLFALLLGQSMVAFSEAMLLGESLGISRAMLFQILLGAPVTAPFLSGKRSKIETGQYDADFPLQWMRKDLQLVSTTGYEQGIALPTANLAKEIFTLAARAGFAEKDFSAVYRFLEQKAQGE